MWPFKTKPKAMARPHAFVEPEPGMQVAHRVMERAREEAYRRNPPPAPPFWPDPPPGGWQSNRSDDDFLAVDTVNVVGAVVEAIADAAPASDTFSGGGGDFGGGGADGGW